MSDAAALSVRDLRSGYVPEIDIVQGVSLVVAPRTVSVVIGPNGAGKSTLLRTIFGLVRTRSGRIDLGNAPIEREAPHRIKQLGVAYIPQTANTFGGLTVEENLRMGAWLVRRDRAGVAARIEQAFATFPILAERRKKKASELSGGQARMLSIARETMSEPRLLLVDEPTAGLAPAVVAQVYGALRTACDSLGAAMLLVDQAIEDAVAIADDVVLLDLGRVRAAGPAGEFGPPRVRELIRECLAG